jgi:dTDP-4-amino-4,6-dideoxygalactose transaminase
MIAFNKASITDVEKNFVLDALSHPSLCGDGKYTKAVQHLFKTKFGISEFLLITSCTHALDMTALLLNLKDGDEVIVPSYTFVSTVNAFMLRGARPRFVDVDKKTMNMDAGLIEPLINEHTKAIYPVHYAGVCCDMDEINAIAKRYNLAVVEDAAQAVGSTYKGKAAGTLSDLGCYSFHETKNYAMGEGGALLVNNSQYTRQAEIIREKGTDRSRFLRGEVDKYTWQAVGSSFLPSDVLAALLYGQMERFDEIMRKRMAIWDIYHHGLEFLEKKGNLQRPFIPAYDAHNAHMYYLILPSMDKRDGLIEHLKGKGISSVFHYIPLHSSPMGLSLGYKADDLPITEGYAHRLVRLPMYADMKQSDAEAVIDCITGRL